MLEVEVDDMKLLGITIVVYHKLEQMQLLQIIESLNLVIDLQQDELVETEEVFTIILGIDEVEGGFIQIETDDILIALSLCDLIHD